MKYDVVGLCRLAYHTTLVENFGITSRVEPLLWDTPPRDKKSYVILNNVVSGSVP